MKTFLTTKLLRARHREDGDDEPGDGVRDFFYCLRGNNWEPGFSQRAGKKAAEETSSSPSAPPHSAYTPAKRRALAGDGGPVGFEHCIRDS